jgi:endonuclease/exonuclease/phosphatase family metal-dependent hydrolase
MTTSRSHWQYRLGTNRWWAGVLLCLAYLLVATVTHAQPLRVMTFNVRLPTDQDGENRWEARRDLVVETLRAEDPDVIGTQELYKRQGDELVARLPEYTWFGEGRKGGTDDEHMGVFYRKDRLKVRDSGNFWLSDSPDVPGSRTWGNLYPRLVTWARFERIVDGLTFTFYNTHLPYRDVDEDARVRGAQLILARLKELPRNEIVILVGDFNAPPDSRVYTTLTGTVSDAWTESPKRSGPEGTFHRFTGKPERRIDWILFRGLEPLRASTVTTNREQRYPSDHFPVVVEFDVPGKAP